MKELNIIEKIQWWIHNDLPTYFCRHDKIVMTSLSNEIFDGYGDYHGHCHKCWKDMRVLIFETMEDRDKNLNQ